MDYQSLAGMFVSQARRFGNKTLYRFAQQGQWRSLSWNEALVRVRGIALGLLSLGVERGDRIAILSNNRVEWNLIDWANICIGALTVPIYASGTRLQALHVVGHSDPTVLFVESAQKLRQLELQSHSLDRLRSVVVIEGRNGDTGVGIDTPVLTLDRLCEIGQAHGEGHDGVFERLVGSLQPEDDLTIIYTSGTTGTPKGVLTTHAHYLYMIRAVDAAVPSTDQDVTLHFLPSAHSLGRLEHFMAVAKGWTIGFARSVDTIPRDLRAIRPTVIFSVPRIYENAYKRIRLRMGRAGVWRRKIFDWVLSVGKQRIENLTKSKETGRRTTLALRCADWLVLSRLRAAFGGRLRLAISGGAPLAPEFAEFFHALGILILEGYGLTETSTVSHVNRPDNYKFGTVGLPLEGVECRIAADGEILLRGPNIFKLYYRDLLATQEAIDADGWFHTGDIGATDRDGFLCVTDRKQDLIVTSGGKKIAPQKLENLLKTEPPIHQVLIVGRGQRHLLALITLDRKQVTELAREEGIKIGDGEEIASHPWVQQRVRQIIQNKNKELAPFEAIRNFCILNRDFTVEDEELTPSLKPRRQVIMERYKELIDEMYRKAS